MKLARRSFLKAVASAAPAAALRHLVAQTPASAPAIQPHVVASGQDVTGHLHPLGFSSLAFKVDPAETSANLFIIEHRNLLPDSGPALHMHLSQEEWFYVMEGEVVLQVGDQRLHLRTGESVLAPRLVPHTFSATGSSAHMLIAFTPACKMEQYLIDAAASPSLAATEAFMNRYDMKWSGPSPFWKH